MTIPKGLAARAVIETGPGKPKLYLEIREGSRFSNFYSTCSVMGCGRHRIVTLGCPRHRGFADSIEEAAEKMAKTMKDNAKRIQKVNIEVYISIRVYRKRLYRKLLSMRPDELGLTYVRTLFDHGYKTKPIQPIRHTLFAKRGQLISK